MSANKFELDVNDVLGFSYQEYVQHLRGVALSTPAAYMALRSDVMKAVKRKTVGDLYKTIFDVMTKGDIAGVPTLGRGKYVPCFPSQQVNDLCIKIASDLADHLNVVCDHIVPDFESIANGKMALKGQASHIDLATVTNA